MKTSAPTSASSAEPAKPSGFVRSANAVFHGPRPVASAVDRALTVAADDVPHAGGEQHVGGRDAGRADPDDHDADVLRARLSTSRSELKNAASTTIAVPCWSSWKTGMSSASRSRLSISKQRGAEMSSRLMPPKPGAIAVTAATISSVSFVARQIGHASTRAELLEQHRLALHHRHRRLGPDVAEPEHRRPVAHDRDRVLLDRQVPDLALVLGDREADPRDAGRVGHRQVVARLQRRLGRHLDLPAEVEQERAIGDVLDLDAGQAVHGGDDPLDVLRARGVDGDVADLLALLDAHEIDRAEVAAGVADRAREVGERARAIVEVDTQRRAEGRRRTRRAHASIVAEVRANRSATVSRSRRAAARTAAAGGAARAGRARGRLTQPVVARPLSAWRKIAEPAPRTTGSAL